MLPTEHGVNPRESASRLQAELAIAPELEEPEHRPFPFRRVLPLAQLLLCALLLWPYRGWIAWDLFGVLIHSGTPRNGMAIDGDSGLPMQPSPELDQWWHRQDNAMDMVAALNLPAGLAQLPYAILSADHREWGPGKTDFKTWRAISWPVLALPFWWMAGRGVEALNTARRKLLTPLIGWTATVISAVLMAGGVTLAIGFLFAGTDRGDPQLRLFVAAGGMWSVLGSLTVVAKLAQWRIKKNTPVL